MAPRPKSPASLSLINQADNLECANENDLTLYHVLVLFRHGDRSPISRNVSTKVKMTQIDTEFWASRLADLSVVDALNSGTQVVTFHNGRCSEESCYGQDFKMPPPPKQGGRWPCGQLTAKGIDMMKKKGECLRERYKNLLNHMEDPTQQVYVESTNIRRTIRSAQSLLAGLFPDYFTNVDAEKKLAIRKNLESQETQHSVLINGEMKKQEVFVIHADDSNSLVPQHSNELYTDLGKILDAEIKMHGPPGFHEALQKVSTIIGAGSDKLIGWTRLREALVCYKAHGLAFPNGLDQQLFMQICEYDAWLWHHFYGKMAMCRLSFKSGVQRLYLYLNDVIKGATKHKLSLFSAHDNSLVAFGNALQLQIPRVIPSYGAMLTFEIYQHCHTGEFYFKTLYEGVEVTFADHEHSTLCPFLVFQQAAQRFLQMQVPQSNAAL